MGELEIIRTLEEELQTTRHAVVGFGDDVSAVKLPEGKAAVLKTDMLVGSTDVPPGMTMRQASRKAVVSSVSDFAAKGVRPLAGLVALGLPKRFTNNDIRGIAYGLHDASREYRFPIVGGDTNESEDLTISIALFAVADRKQLVLRTGARSDDVLAVTGRFGDTSAALKGLLEKHLRAERLSKPLRDAVFMPRAQLELGVRLARSRVLNASIDSSDGLAWSLHELADANHLGIKVDHVPVSRAAAEFAARYECDAAELALFGGEEFSLVVAVNKNKLKLARRAAQGNLIPIGSFTRKFKGVRLQRAGRKFNIPRRGWEHFKSG